MTGIDYNTVVPYYKYISQLDNLFGFLFILILNPTYCLIDLNEIFFLQIFEKHLKNWRLCRPRQ